MNNLRAAIDVLFRKISPDSPLDTFFNGKSQKNFYESAWGNQTERFQIFNHLQYYSHDEINNVWQKVKDDWAIDKDTGKASVFGLLYQFTKCTLLQEGNSLCVDFKDLMRWRELSHLIGEEILTTCFLSQRDRVSNHKRSFFAWSPILTTNNNRLKELLKKGTAENHFHLGGSAPHFDISWIAIMNKVINREQDFKTFLKKGKLDPSNNYNESNSQTELYILSLKACYIRIFLFNILKGNINNRNDSREKDILFSEENIKRILSPSSDSKNSLYLITILPTIQRHINTLRYLYGKTIDHSMSFGCPDYCIPKNIDSDNVNGNIMLCGERKFIYECFSSFFKSNEDIVEYADLFYTYLLIKSQFRSEMIQINSNVGFANFSNYQDRKSIFIGDKTIYAKAVNNMAVNGSFRNQTIKSLEARFKPKSTKEKNVQTIKSLDKAINSECFSNKNYNAVDRFLQRNNHDFIKDDFFYVAHFIKKKDKLKGAKGIKEEIFAMTCRDATTRMGAMLEAKALIKLRSSMSEVANRIRGIDAASSEINCRPEAFAQSYRYIKYHRINGRFDSIRDNKDLPVLKATFHAGEDFLDIVDGMRAIDETIKFLNLDDGDRIGHALALGISVKDYYESKHRDLMLPKHWHLDNIVWLISRINKYQLHQFSTYENLLNNQFCKLFNEIYGHVNEFMNISSDLYYESWKLRGNDPDLYKTGEYKKRNNINFWQRCGINERYPEGGKVEKGIIGKLYHHYHFDAKVKNIGNQIKRFKIESEYIKVVTEVQKEFQIEIAQQHLGIETNPSSNYLIGTFKRYDKHPLINFFNYGLELNYDKVEKCPQLFVSINTDDQGVFNTYLENEYALMALALEKMEDEDGKRIYKSAMIYDWLDKIRQMGLEMSFNQN